MIDVCYCEQGYLGLTIGQLRVVRHGKCSSQAGVGVCLLCCACMVRSGLLRTHFFVEDRETAQVPQSDVCVARQTLILFRGFQGPAPRDARSVPLIPQDVNWNTLTEGRLEKRLTA
jgi:hypothetical protein